MLILKFLLCVCFLSITTYSKNENPIDLEVVYGKNKRENNGITIKNTSQKRLRTRLPNLSLQEQLAQLEKALHNQEIARYNQLINNQKKCKEWSGEEFAEAARFTGKISDPDWLFDQWQLYTSPAYRAFLKSHVGNYEDNLLVAYERLCKKYNYTGYNWHMHCDEGLCHLNCIAGECKDIKNRREVAERKRQARLRNEAIIRDGYKDNSHEFNENIDDYYDALDLYDDCDTQSDRFERRMQAIFADEALLHFEHKEYCLSDDVKQKLRQHQASPYEYEHCYGSALQQTIHQECIDIVDRAIHLSSDHPAYEHKDALIDLADGARMLNQAGKTEKAMSVADVCWGILDCCSAVIEGAVEGAIGAVVDIYNNPLQTVASLTIGNYVMAYQALKIATNLADIGITSLIDAQAGREKWDDYIAPITNVITAVGTAFANNEISLRDALKQGTKLVVQYKTQGKILGGLGKFYSTVKTKAINYIEKNPLATPQMYMTTPEGVMFKAVDESFCAGQSAAKFTSSTSADVKQLSKSALKKLRKRNNKKTSIKSLVKAAELPHTGKLRYVPPKKFDVANGLPRGISKNGDEGFVDRFKNIWVEGKSRTIGARGFKQERVEWDVQLSPQGVQQVGWMTRDNTHLNVSLKGRVTHK